MDVSDVAAADCSRTGSRFQAIGEIRFVDVANDPVHEVATSDIAVAIHGERGFTGGARFARTGMAMEIPVKVWIHREQAFDFVRSVVVGLSFERVDPEVNFGTERPAQFLNRSEVFTQPDHTDAVANLARV